MQNQFDYIVSNSFNAAGNDEFPLALGSAGTRTIQLQQALRVLGESIDEQNFGTQTRVALIHLGYPPAVNDIGKLNEIVLRAHSLDKKQVSLTEPQLRVLYEREVPVTNRPKSESQLITEWNTSKDKFGKLGSKPDYNKWKEKQPSGVSFEDWIKRENIKIKAGKGTKAVADVLFGWLKMKTAGAGDTSGAPAEQPVDTDEGWLSKKAGETEIPNGVILIGGIVGAGLLIWGISALAKRSQKVVYVQSAPVGA